MFHRSNADLRSCGYKYCLYKVARTNLVPKESASGCRTPVSVKGQRCKKLVNPERIKELGGVPICHKHKALYLADLDEAEALGKKLRAKYDPGPLDLGGEEHRRKP